MTREMRERFDDRRDDEVSFERVGCEGRRQCETVSRVTSTDGVRSPAAESRARARGSRHEVTTATAFTSATSASSTSSAGRRWRFANRRQVRSTAAFESTSTPSRSQSAAANPVKGCGFTEQPLARQRVAQPCAAHWVPQSQSLIRTADGSCSSSLRARTRSAPDQTSRVPAVPVSASPVLSLPRGSTIRILVPGSARGACSTPAGTV